MMNDKNQEIKPERIVNKSSGSGSSFRVIVIISIIIGGVFYYYSTRDDLKKEALKIISDNNQQSVERNTVFTSSPEIMSTSETSKDLYTELYELYAIPPLPLSVFRLSDIKEQLDIPGFNFEVRLRSIC